MTAVPIPSQYQGMIISDANANGVPPSLLGSLLNEESGFNPNALNSSSGAEGIAQFLPSTAAGEGVNPWDPSSAINGAARMLESGFKTFGSWSLSLAAYNAGGNAVSKYGGIPPYPETQQYISDILSNAAGPYSYLDGNSGITPSPSPSPSPTQTPQTAPNPLTDPFGSMMYSLKQQFSGLFNPNWFGQVPLAFLFVAGGLFMVGVIVILSNHQTEIVQAVKGAAETEE